MTVKNSGDCQSLYSIQASVMYRIKRSFRVLFSRSQSLEKYAVLHSGVVCNHVALLAWCAVSSHSPSVGNGAV